MTTILSVRRNGKVVVGGDGQVSLGNTILKGNARKVRKLNNGTVISGFAGSTADAFTLLDIFEQQIKTCNGNLEKAVIAFCKLWRTDKALRRLEAMTAFYCYQSISFLIYLVVHILVPLWVILYVFS